MEPFDFGLAQNSANEPHALPIEFGTFEPIQNPYLTDQAKAAIHSKNPMSSGPYPSSDLQITSFAENTEPLNGTF